jgi:hypothetical protein
VSHPLLAVGEDVDIVIIASQPSEYAEDAIDIIESEPGGQLYKTPEDVDEYLKQERESWDC